MKTTPLARNVLLATLALGTLASGAYAFGNELCEPARLSGKANLHQTAGEEDGMGMMRGRRMGMGMMRGREHGAGMGRRRGNPVRHRVVMMGPGLPDEYATLKNPLPATAENIEAGRKIYEENCASCHGPRGEGDGEAGKELDPRPANIAFVIDKPIATDGFLFWTISEGGEKLGTAMPAFKDVLSRKERWQVILYLRTFSQ